MKLLIPKGVIFFFSLFSWCTPSLFAEQRTEDMAVELGYPKLITTLRNNAEKFLTSENIRMTVDVDQVHDEGHEYRARGLKDRYHNEYVELEKRIDTAFTEISDMFINGAIRLDDHDAKDSQRRDFINKMKRIAELKIDALIKQKGEKRAK